MEIRIKNLRLRTVIGIEDWERRTLQDVVVNVLARFDGRAAAASDVLVETVNYKTITKEIIAHVEAARVGLIEKLATDVLAIVLRHDGVTWARVEIDKPGALRFTDSVSIAVEGEPGKP